MPRKADFLGTASVPPGVRNTFRHDSHTFQRPAAVWHGSHTFQRPPAVRHDGHIIQRSAAFRHDGHILQRSAALGFLACDKRVELEPSGRGLWREADEE